MRVLILGVGPKLNLFYSISYDSPRTSSDNYTICSCLTPDIYEDNYVYTATQPHYTFASIAQARPVRGLEIVYNQPVAYLEKGKIHLYILVSVSLGR